MKECPALSTVARFNIDRQTANECKIFNRAYYRHLLALKDLYPNDTGIQSAIEDTEKLYRIWDDYSDAMCEYYYIHIRRQALKKLEYYSSLPPPVPYWYFTEVRYLKFKWTRFNAIKYRSLLVRNADANLIYLRMRSLIQCQF